MDKAVQRLDGVEKATISLNRGLADVQLKPQNHFSLNELRQKVRSAGFTAGPMTVTASGEIVHWKNQLAFQVGGRNDLVFLLAPVRLTHVPGAVGTKVTLTGTVLPSRVKGQPDTLQVTKIEAPAK